MALIQVFYMPIFVIVTLLIVGRASGLSFTAMMLIRLAKLKKSYPRTITVCSMSTHVKKYNQSHQYLPEQSYSQVLKAQKQTAVQFGRLSAKTIAVEIRRPQLDGKSDGATF